VAAEHDLLLQANLFGLRTAMDARRGHFPGISDWPLAIQQAIQSVRNTFSATGFEAAAGTSTGIGPGAAGGIDRPQHTVRVIRVAFDRPFGYLAVDRTSRLVLVAGWVENPTRHPGAGEFEKRRLRLAGPSYAGGLGPEGESE
jgi:serine protease inhibitor